MNGNQDFTKTIMLAIVSIILLCAVAIPIITAMPQATGDYGGIINTLVGIVPVVLAVSIIIGIVYSLILRNRD